MGRRTPPARGHGGSRRLITSQTRIAVHKAVSHGKVGANQGMLSNANIDVKRLRRQIKHSGQALRRSGQQINSSNPNL